MKIRTVPADDLRPDLSLSPRHYIQSDLDRVTETWKARYPGKTVKVTQRNNGFTVSVTETFHVNKRGDRFDV
jgi:hypothetical protein